MDFNKNKTFIKNNYFNNKLNYFNNNSYNDIVNQIDKQIYNEKNNDINIENNIIKQPIISIGIICYIYDNDINDYKFLLIRRKDTLGYVDFLRGKYNLYNKSYIMNILNEMTIYERNNLLNGFEYNWNKLWGNVELKQRYLNEEIISKEKYKNLLVGIKTNNEMYNLKDCLDNVTTNWIEPEWGFPKGRREYKEKEFNTALREFYEETGINSDFLEIINNVQPYEEIFNGSNFKSYKHKYYLAKLSDKNISLNKFQKTEVSAMEFKTYNEAIECFRDYDYEKKEILSNVYFLLKNYEII